MTMFADIEESEQLLKKEAIVLLGQCFRSGLIEAYDHVDKSFGFFSDEQHGRSEAFKKSLESMAAKITDRTVYCLKKSGSWLAEDPDECCDFYEGLSYQQKRAIIQQNIMNDYTPLECRKSNRCRGKALWNRLVVGIASRVLALIQPHWC